MVSHAEPISAWYGCKCRLDSDDTCSSETQSDLFVYDHSDHELKMGLRVCWMKVRWGGHREKGEREKREKMISYIISNGDYHGIISK